MATTEEAKLRVVLDMKDKLSPQMKKAGKNVTSVNNKLKGMRTALVGISAVAVGSLTLATKEFVAFDKGMREVNTLLDQNEAQFQGMSDQVKQLAVTMGIDAVDATKSLYQAISSGIPPQNALTFMETAARLSIGGVTDLETATLGLKTALNAYSMDVSRSEEVSDVLFETMRLGTTTIGELSSFMFQAVPTAAAFGVSLEEVAAATAVVTRQGSPTSFVMRGLRAAMVALVKPTEDMSVLIRKMGYESGGAALESLGLQRTLQGLLEASGGSKDALTAAGLQAESLAVVFGITGDKAEQFADFLVDITDSAGATTAAVEKMEVSASRGFDRMQSAFQIAKVELGEAFMPVVAKTLEVITDLMKMLINLGDGAKIAIVAFTALLGVFALIALAIPPLIGLFIALNIVSGGMLIVIGSIVTAVALMAAGFVILAGDIGGARTAMVEWNANLEESMDRMRLHMNGAIGGVNDFTRAIKSANDGLAEFLFGWTGLEKSESPFDAWDIPLFTAELRENSTEWKKMVADTRISMIDDMVEVADQWEALFVGFGKVAKTEGELVVEGVDRQVSGIENNFRRLVTTFGDVGLALDIYRQKQQDAADEAERMLENATSYQTQLTNDWLNMYSVLDNNFELWKASMEDLEDTAIASLGGMAFAEDEHMAQSIKRNADYFDNLEALRAENTKRRAEEAEEAAKAAAEAAEAAAEAAEEQVELAKKVADEKIKEAERVAAELAKIALEEAKLAEAMAKADFAAARHQAMTMTFGVADTSGMFSGIGKDIETPIAVAFQAAMKKAILGGGTGEIFSGIQGMVNRRKAERSRFTELERLKQGGILLGENLLTQTQHAELEWLRGFALNNVLAGAPPGVSASFGQSMPLLPDMKAPNPQQLVVLPNATGLVLDTSLGRIIEEQIADTASGNQQTSFDVGSGMVTFT